MPSFTHKDYVRGIMRAVRYFDKHPKEFVSGWDLRHTNNPKSVPADISENVLYTAIYLDGKRRNRAYTYEECRQITSRLPVEVQIVVTFNRLTEFPDPYEYAHYAGWAPVRPKLMAYLAFLGR